MADIATCPECSKEMDVSSAAPYDRVVCPHCQKQSRAKMSFDQFTLQRRLAWGGMSVVFIAYDSVRRHRVAIKMLSDTYFKNPMRVAQFEREAEHIASVDHPNVVKFYSIGRAFGRPYLAMEWVEGETLETMLESRKPLPEAMVIQIGLQVIAGLEASREAGLIHRDIKPGNILVGEESAVKILDFGLSMLTEGGQARAEEVFATPYYVSPESLEGEEEDFRSDIYSLGATLYHALLGKPPFETTSTEIAFLRETKKSIPPLLSRASGVTRATALVVEKAMAFQRELRFANYAQFTEALHAAAQGQALGPVSRRRSRARQAKRSRTAWSLRMLAGVVVLILLFAAWTLLQGGRKEDSGSSPSDRDGVARQTPLSAQSLIAIEREARSALVSGEFSTAEELFRQLFRSGELSEPDATWAVFQSALCALMDGRSGDSRDGFRLLARHLQSPSAPNDLRVLGETMLKDWEELGMVPLLVTEPGSDEEAFISFARALRNWEQGELSSAAAMTQFQDRAVRPESAWMRPYQAWAESYQRDAALLTAVEPDWELLAKESSQIVGAKQEVLQVQSRLSTKGRARFTIESWLDWMNWQQQRN